MLDFYFDFFAANAFGKRLCCMHDVLAVAIAAGTLEPTLMPTVSATVDTGDGAGRGQTIFDLRGRYSGFPAQADAHCRVVLECDPGFAAPVVELLGAAGPSRIGASGA
jgi:purine nucleosidase